MSDESCNKTYNNLQQTCNQLAIDSISRLAAIDVIENFGILDGYMDRLDLIDRIKDLPSAQPEQRWIPCSKQLPKNGYKYLYCTDMGIVHMGFYFDGYGFEHGIKYGYNIIAWMPLPEPYKGEKVDV